MYIIESCEKKFDQNIEIAITKNGPRPIFLIFFSYKIL